MTFQSSSPSVVMGMDINIAATDSLLVPVVSAISMRRGSSALGTPPSSTAVPGVTSTSSYPVAEVTDITVVSKSTSDIVSRDTSMVSVQLVVSGANSSGRGSSCKSNENCNLSE